MVRASKRIKTTQDDAGKTNEQEENVDRASKRIKPTQDDAGEAEEDARLARKTKPNDDVSGEGETRPNKKARAEDGGVHELKEDIMDEAPVHMGTSRQPDIVEVFSPPRTSKMAERISEFKGVALDLRTVDNEGRRWDFDDAKYAEAGSVPHSREATMSGDRNTGMHGLQRSTGGDPRVEETQPRTVAATVAACHGAPGLLRNVVRRAGCAGKLVPT